MTCSSVCARWCSCPSCSVRSATRCSSSYVNRRVSEKRDAFWIATVAWLVRMRPKSISSAVNLRWIWECTKTKPKSASLIANGRINKALVPRSAKKSWRGARFSTWLTSWVLKVPIDSSRWSKTGASGRGWGKISVIVGYSALNMSESVSDINAEIVVSGMACWSSSSVTWISVFVSSVLLIRFEKRFNNAKRCVRLSSSSVRCRLCW